MALVLTVVLVAACGGGDDGEAAPTTASPPTSGAPTTEPPTTTEPLATTAPPTTVAPEVAPFVVDQVAAGDQHTCAVDADGGAWCWGESTGGELGDGTGEPTAVPVRVAGDLVVSDLATGRYVTCALDVDGAPWCWGANGFAQLGDGTGGDGGADADRGVPAPVAGGLTGQALTAGQAHVCLLDASGAASCWGASSSGQLGSDAGRTSVPVASAVELDLVALVAGGGHTCGLDGAGAAWCWGSNTFGQLGDGAPTNAGQAAPRPVLGGIAFASLDAGHRHTCGVDVDGGVWCWGDGRDGQIGPGATEAAAEPVAVPLAEAVVAVSARWFPHLRGGGLGRGLVLGARRVRPARRRRGGRPVSAAEPGGGRPRARCGVGG